MKMNFKAILLGIILFIGIIGVFVYFQVNKKVTDITTVKEEATFRMDEIMQMDEDAINAMNDKVISITGIVLSNKVDENSVTLTLGSNEMNAIICQADNRYLETMRKLNKGHFVKLKGVVSGHDFDVMLGKTIQMKNCVLTQ